MTPHSRGSISTVTCPPPKGGWLLGAAVYDGDRLCAVVAVERPARMLSDGFTACVSRLCTDRTPHAASKALAAVTRACVALGYRRLVSYTLLGESGLCYRAAGWRVTAIVRARRSWSCPSRPRAAAVQPGRKARWEYGPDAMPLDAAAEALVRERVGLEPMNEMDVKTEGGSQ